MYNIDNNNISIDGIIILQQKNHKLQSLYLSNLYHIIILYIDYNNNT